MGYPLLAAQIQRRRFMPKWIAGANGASSLLSGESQGLAFDFTDQTALIRDTGTPANNYASGGYVTGGTLVGPGGKLTYTSPSNKLTLQSDGYIKYQAHNLYLNSASPADQAITVVSGASYAVTITGTVSVTASGAATGTWTAGTNTFTAATTTLTLGSTSGSGTVHVRRTPSNDDYIATAGAAKYALPLEYDTSGNCEGLLVEEARTNLIVSSSDLGGTGWTQAGVTQSSDATLDIFGQTAQRFAQSDPNEEHRISRTTGVLANSTTYTMSCYFKRYGSANAIGFFSNSAGAAYYATFDFSGGGAPTIGSYVAGTNYVAGSAAVEDVGNGWYRCRASFLTTASVAQAIQIRMYSNGAGAAPFDGTTTDGFYISQPQLEAGAFPTSPILTYGAAATRNADNISIATSAFPHSDSTQSVFVQVITQNTLATTSGAPFFEFNDGTTNNRYGLDRYSTGAACRVLLGGVPQTNATINGFITDEHIQAGGNPFKGAMSIATNDVSYVGNGGTVTTDATASLPTVTSLRLGAGVVQPSFCGTIQSISVVPRTKSDAELQAETA